MGHHDVCGFLHTQVQKLHLLFSILVYPEDLILQTRSIDEVLK